TVRAMRDGRIHLQPVWRRLLSGDDEVDVVAAAQAMIGDGEKAIRVRRKIDADDLGFLVGHVIDKAGILMRKAVVILSPHMRREQVVERSDRFPPGNAASRFQPFGVLIEHGVDDVNERLVAREKAMASGEQITLEPALAHVLAENFHYASIGGEM